MRTFQDRDTALEYVLEQVPFGTAAGTCRDPVLAGRLAAAGSKIVTFGSDTLEAQDPNPGDNFYYDEETGIGVNAWGIGNRGVRADMDNILAAKRAVNACGSQLWVSGSVGKTANPNDYYHIARLLLENNAADVAEANYSCGNMRRPDGTFKPAICNDAAALDDAVAAFAEGAGDIPTVAKLGPTTDQELVERNVAICLKHRVRYIVFANTIVNCYVEKPDGSPAITMRRGGASGSILIPIVTSMLQMAAPLVIGTSTELIAAGGVSCGRVAYHYLKHRAAGFVFNTELTKRNYDPKVTVDIVEGDESRGLLGLVDFLVKHGLPD